MEAVKQMQRLKGADVHIMGLTKKYGDIFASKDVNLTVESGKFLTLLGPSGSGKTTILMSIAGFVEPTSGDILVNGESVLNRPPHLRNIGMVFQNYALFPHMTVFENIAFPLKMRKYAKPLIEQRVKEVLELVKLEDFGSRKISQMSGGQQQRIALARALVFNPPLLLMDEPLGALDRKLREHMQLEIMKIQQALNITVIYVTHDQEEALVMSDSIAILRDAVLLQEGPPAEVYAHPCNPFVADFLGESNFLDGNLLRIDGEEALVTLHSGQQIQAARYGEFRPGDEVRCIARPECLHLTSLNRGNQEGFSSMKGTIKEVIYVGDSTKYTVEIGEGDYVVVKVLNRPEQEIFSAGQGVHICYNPKTILALAKEH